MTRLSCQKGKEKKITQESHAMPKCPVRKEFWFYTLFFGKMCFVKLIFLEIKWLKSIKILSICAKLFITRMSRATLPGL